VWPAVPYSSLSREVDEGETTFGLDDFPAPPKLALNGVSSDIPVSPYSKALSGMQGFESEESKARRREMDGLESSYPRIAPPSLRQPVSFNSPVIPLSPDPFGRFPSASPPSASEGSESAEVRSQARISYSTFGIPPERNSSLGSLSGGDSTVASHTDPASAPPSSRFSIDSTDEGKNNRTTASLNPVKSIKSLWRKNRKASVSSGPGSTPPSWTASGRTSPQSLFPLPNLPGPSVQRSPTPTSLGASRESVANLAPLTDRYPPSVPSHNTPLSSKSPSPRLTRESSSINSMVFDQESPYPVLASSQRLSGARPRISPQHTGPLSPTLTRRSSMRQSDIPPLPDTESDATPPHANSQTDRERTGAPKSILKPWRSDNSAGSPLPEQYATRSRRSRGGSEVYVGSKPPGMGGNRVSASIEPTRPPPPTSPPRRLNRGTLRSIPSQDNETFKIMDPPRHPELGQSF
jgi:hypothetical protein